MQRVSTRIHRVLFNNMLQHIIVALLLIPLILGAPQTYLPDAMSIARLLCVYAEKSLHITLDVARKLINHETSQRALLQFLTAIPQKVEHSRSSVPPCDFASKHYAWHCTVKIRRRRKFLSLYELKFGVVGIEKNHKSKMSQI